MHTEADIRKVSADDVPTQMSRRLYILISVHGQNKCLVKMSLCRCQVGLYLCTIGQDSLNILTLFMIHNASNTCLEQRTSFESSRVCRAISVLEHRREGETFSLYMTFCLSILLWNTRCRHTCHQISGRCTYLCNKDSSSYIHAHHIALPMRKIIVMGMLLNKKAPMLCISA